MLVSISRQASQQSVVDSIGVLIWFTRCPYKHIFPGSLHSMGKPGWNIRRSKLDLHTSSQYLLMLVQGRYLWVASVSFKNTKNLNLKHACFILDLHMSSLDLHRSTLDLHTSRPGLSILLQTVHCTVTPLTVTLLLAVQNLSVSCHLHQHQPMEIWGRHKKI